MPSLTVEENPSELTRAKKTLFLKDALDNNVSVDALYVGYYNGDLLLVRRFMKEHGYRKYDPPAESSYVVISSRKDGLAEIVFYNRNFRKLKIISDAEYGYDATSRVWSRQAMKSD